MDTNLNAKANGIGSIALGGFRGDKPNGIPDQLPENDKNTTEIADIDTITVVDGIQAAAFGAGNRAYGNWNFIAGKDNKTFQKGSFAFGGKNAVGNPAKPNDYCYSIAVGESNKVLGRSCFIGGASNESKNNAQYGITYGSNNVSEGIASIVVGSSITMSHVTTAAAFGGEHTINNSCAFVSGVGSKTGGYASSALGGYLTTNANYQTVIGVLNKPNPDAMFVIGNGTNTNNLKNIFEVLNDGRAKVHKAPEEDNDVVRKLELEESWSNFNIENGEGSGAIQQTGYTLEGVHNDFKHYAAAYGIAVAQGLEGVEAVEQLMSTYSYEQLLSMIAQVNFGGNTEQAQTYLYNMIDQVLSDNNLEFLPNEVNGSASTALGVGNKLWSPVAFVSGYKNLIGKRGSPYDSMGAAAIGNENIVEGWGAAAIGNELIAKGTAAIALGKKHSISTSQFDDQLDKNNVEYFLENLQNADIIFDETNRKFTFDGVHSGKNLSFNGYIDEEAGSNNIALGGSAIGPGSNNFCSGNQLVIKGDNNAQFGLLNGIVGNNNFVAGVQHRIISSDYSNSRYDDTLTSSTVSNVNAVFNRNSYITDCYDTFTAGCNNIVSNRWASMTLGYRLKNEVQNYKTVVGKFNKDTYGNLFEVGAGSSDTGRRNSFEVLEDGRAKVYGVPVDAEDVIRKSELDNAINILLDDEGATAALDSFKELQVLLGTDTTGATGLINQVNDNTKTINTFNDCLGVVEDMDCDESGTSGFILVDPQYINNFSIGMKLNFADNDDLFIINNEDDFSIAVTTVTNIEQYDENYYKLSLSKDMSNAVPYGAYIYRAIPNATWNLFASLQNRITALENTLKKIATNEDIDGLFN